MLELLRFIRDLLRLGERSTAALPAPHRHGDGETVQHPRPLYIGRGIVCLGGEQQRSNRRVRQG